MQKPQYDVVPQMCDRPYPEKTEVNCFPGTKHKKPGPNKANKKSVTDRDVNVFKVSGNLKK